MVLNRRILREFKENKIKYLGIILLILISSMIVVGFAGSSDSIINTGHEASIQNNVEDGEFLVNSKLTKNTLSKIENLGVTINEAFYCDYKIDDTKKIRLFKVRDDINKISIIDGKYSEDDNSIMIDTHFGQINNLNLGNSLKIKGRDLKISAYCASPDYSYVIEKTSDLVSSPDTFGMGFVSEKNFNSLKNISYSYSYKLNGACADTLKTIISKNASLKTFLKAENNPRIRGYIDDIAVNKKVSVIVGILLFILIAFMISNILINNIDSESAFIGALFALGYRKNELIKHYIILPTIMVLIGAVAGSIIGFSIEGFFIESSIETYSLPAVKTYFPPDIIAFGCVIPVLITVLINYFMLRKNLMRSPLSLLRKEKKENTLTTIKIKHFSFLTTFKLRQFLREYKSSVILFFGILLATFLLVMGICCSNSLKQYTKDLDSSLDFKYTYILKMPIEVNHNKDTEKITFKSLSFYFKDLNQDMDVCVEGIEENSRFFNFNIKDDDDGIYASESVLKKFGFKKGDTICLKDTSENKIYNMKIKDSVYYPSGLYIFMNRKSFNKFLNVDNSYFNGYITNQKLDIDEDYIYSKTNKNDMIGASEKVINSLQPTFKFLIILSSILFIIITYIILKLNISKCETGISLVKIFGYNRKEISKLYLGSSLYTVIVSSLIAVPLNVKFLGKIYKNIIVNASFYTEIKASAQNYIFIFAVIFLSYFISLYFLKKHLEKIDLVEALKNRE